MSKFIYVFNNKDAKKLLTRGYELCRNDDRNQIWVCVNKDPENLEFTPDFQCVLSDVLSF